MLIEGSKTEYVEVRVESFEEFKEKYPGFLIHTVDDKEVVGTCEACSYPILEDEPYQYDREGIMWHKHNCWIPAEERK